MYQDTVRDQQKCHDDTVYNINSWPWSIESLQRSKDLFMVMGNTASRVVCAVNCNHNFQFVPHCSTAVGFEGGTVGDVLWLT